MALPQKAGQRQGALAWPQEAGVAKGGTMTVLSLGTPTCPPTRDQDNRHSCHGLTGSVR